MYLDRKTRLFPPGGQNIPRESVREQSEGARVPPWTVVCTQGNIENTEIYTSPNALIGEINDKD